MSASFLATELFAQEEMSLDWRRELQQIDAELKELEDEKNRYLAAARRYDDQGMRWQFQQNQKQEARRAFEMADIKREAASMLQTRIDVLNARKMQILQEHPEAEQVLLNICDKYLIGPA
jgi:hypothetical protein